MCVCVCVCVCMRERERERGNTERGGERERMEEEGKLIMLKEKSERASDFSSLKSKKI